MFSRRSSKIGQVIQYFDYVIVFVVLEVEIDYIKFIWMSATINGIRWNRRNSSQLRNKSTSFIENPTTDTIKLPALNGLNKSIKYGDLSFTTSRDILKLRKEPDQVDNIEEVSAHHSLVVIRKKYDNMNKTREELQRQVADMEIKRDKYLNEKRKFEEDKGKGGQKVQQLSNGLKEIKLKLEESQIEKKVMLHMVERIKTDKVTYDLRKFRFEKQLSYILKQQQIIHKENSGKMEEEDKTRKIYQKLLDHLQAEQGERQAHINSVENMINEKVGLNEGNEIRRAEMKEISENTLQDKDEHEKNWYKVYLCNRFIQRLLRDKMTREMLKFNTVEVAFKNIKLATGVADSKELIRKFLNKENAYGELLGKIAENERSIIQLKNENEEMVRQKRKLKAQQDFLNSNKAELIDLGKQQKEMHQYSQKTTNCHMLVEKLKGWINKSNKKYNSITQNTEEPATPVDHKQIVSELKKYLQKITAAVDQVEEINEKLDLNVSIAEKNCRVMLKEQEIVDKKPNANNDEMDYVNNQRTQLLRSNEKFMKEVRRKQQQVKKALIQAQPKKKQAVVVAKPVPPPE